MSGGLPQRSTGQRRRRRVEEDPITAQPSTAAESLKRDRESSPAKENSASMRKAVPSATRPLELVEHRHAAEDGANYECEVQY